MDTLPVFRHTLEALKEALSSEKTHLYEMTEHFLSDPGLLLNLFVFVKQRHPSKDFNLVQSALAVIGQRGLEELLDSIDTVLEEDCHNLWSYSMLVRCAAENLLILSGITEPDLIVTSSLIPSAGMVAMLKKKVQIKRILPLLLRLNLEDKVFVLERLFGTNHLREIGLIHDMPDIYRAVAYLTGTVFSRTGKRMEELDSPAKFSDSYRAYKLFKLLEVAEYAAQSILFPHIIEAQERCKEQLKRFFQFSEADFEPFLADAIKGFEDLSASYNLQGLSESILKEGSDYSQRELAFTTTSEEFQSDLSRVYDANREGKNLLTWGEPDVGKRLLLAYLHQRQDCPNRSKPFVSVYCSGINADNFESELFGARGGFFGFEKHRGALEIAREGGTVLLKNLDRMPIELQEQLAETIKAGRFRRVGDTKPIDFRCRFFMTSRSNPETSGLIARSLLEVLQPVVLFIPPLRDRRQDIELIANGIIEKYDLPIKDQTLQMGLKEYYETYDFRYNLLELKRLLFFVAAKKAIG